MLYTSKKAGDFRNSCSTILYRRGLMEDREKSEEKRQDKLQWIKNCSLMDDDFTRKFFEDNIQCTELVLRIIMNQDDLKIRKVQTQYEIKNLQGRSICMDVYAEDEHCRKYDLEVQRRNYGADPKRARFNSGIMDANELLEGDEWAELPETFVIFITEKDYFKEGKIIYYIDRKIQGTEHIVKDDLHVIYVNGSYRDDSPLGLLIHDFNCSNPDQMYYKELAERVRYLKHSKEGKKIMGTLADEIKEKWEREGREEGLKKGIQEGLLEGRKEGRKEGEEAAKKELAVKMLKRNKMTEEEIAEDTGLPLEKIKVLADKIKVALI